ncbi:TonB-dependent receptor plug domain-containing protein [Novosphingobium album (ex Liu et al. 2023)]|uniref:TonB-dependent receptor n=1 Tax=Novosphingobium album (ex Liu et al. 2023) TaxID=3031130 RepID=A0ABT5WTI7_9SPHN|nr:TonB-dependent receptor [Novosphingobium album (ex Liu et al. 2023)]MDE8653200.1 TonB-dependent receptor [Novosphingobium album (ex Liu et al. 2023)]
MNPHSRRHFAPGVAHAALALSLAAAAAPTAAWAQEAAAGEGTAQSENTDQATLADDIVVTGTLVRGIAPPGTNVIGVTQADVTATGATTTAQLLQSVPQLGSFNNLQSPTGFGNQITSNRPNLRTLPGFNTSGGSTTLVLMDGHRLVGMGILSTSPDPDVIPPGAIERLEIVPDGGSAVYGSDAVAGVINFITMKEFDGVKVDGHYGFAKNYYQLDASATVGKKWDGGSAYVSYTYTEHDDLYGRDRDYVRQYPSETGFPGLTNLQCSPGNVRVGTSAYYGLPYTTATAAAALGRINQCDYSDDITFYPKEHRHSVLASVSQQLSDSLSFEIKGFYTTGAIDIVTGPYRVQQGQPQTITRTAANASIFDAHRVGTETSQSVFFQYGPLDAQTQTVDLDTWGFTPTFTADLGSGWQARVMGSYSRSDSKSILTNFNTTALANAISAGLFNPYDPGASNAAALAVINDSELYSRTKQDLADLRAVVDGELFQLPGGGVKVAVGAEIYNEKYHILTQDQVSRLSPTSGSAAVSLPNTLGVSTVIRPAIAPIAPIGLSRTVKSVFGELVVPIFGADNATTMLEELTLSVAGRYDHYSDVGSTFNPKFGLTYRPVDWLKFRAAYGKSFNAPSLADAPGTIVSNISFSARLPPAALLAANGGPLPNIRPGSVAAFVQGNAADIQPQKAKTLSLGFDVQPPFLPGFNFSTTFYKIDLKGVIRLPPTDAANVYGAFRSIVTFAGNQAGGSFSATDLANLLGSVSLVRNAPPANIADLYAIIDLRKRNLENFKTHGLDFSGSYDIDTSFGSINLAGNANYELSRKRQPAAGAPYSDEPNVSMFRLRGSVGAQVGNLFGQVVLNHTSGFKLSPAVGFNGTTITGQSYTTQTKVGDFNVFNLFFRYDLKGEGVASDLQLTLNVDNVFNTAPPVYRGDPIAAQYGYIGSLTLGRMVQFGISKKF